MLAERFVVRRIKGKDKIDATNIAFHPMVSFFSLTLKIRMHMDEDIHYMYTFIIQYC